MAEALVMASNANPTTPRGMIVAVMDDGNPWSPTEGLPMFVVIKIPLISVDAVRKYATVYRSGLSTYLGKRLWQIRYASLPQAARDKLSSEGQLTIKATAAYGGAFDYTWAQVKQFFRNLQTGLDETADL